MTADPAVEEAGPDRGRSGGVLLALAILASYVVAGLAAGWLWFTLWEPHDGVVVQHQWYPDGAGLRGAFSGTALYVLVCAGLGLALGLVWSLVGARRPLLTVVVAVIGSAVAAWLVLLVGQALGPPDPQVLAKTADDGTSLPSSLDVSGSSPLVVLSMGTLAALGFVFTIFSGRPEEPTGTSTAAEPVDPATPADPVEAAAPPEPRG